MLIPGVALVVKNSVGKHGQTNEAIQPEKDASYETTSAKRLRELSEDSKLEALVAKNPVTTSIG